MTGAGECGEIRPALGVYILGAISPADRAAVERHLGWCADCRAELTGLAALPGRLGSVPAADITSMARAEADAAERGERPPDVLLQALLDRTAQVRKHLRWRRLAVAAAVVVTAAGGAAAGSRMLDLPPARPAASAVPWAARVSGSDPRTGMSATVEYLPQAWGLALRVQIRGIAAGTRCELQVVGAGGQNVPAGGWTVTPGHASVWYPASSPFPASGVHGFVITTARGRPLVHLPPV